MERRSFVKSLTLGLGAILLAPRLGWRPSHRIPPRLYADAVHDDTAALQWYIDHKVPTPPGGNSLIPKTLRVPPRGKMQMHWSRLTGTGGVEPLIFIEPKAPAVLWGNII